MLTVEFHSGGVAPAGKLEIKTGAYEGKTPIGQSTVVIRTPDGRIPAQFKDMSGLQRDVKAGDNEFDFPSKSTK